MKQDDPFKTTKIEKTGDNTFNVKTADGGHFECQSKEKLSSLKNINHVKIDSVFSGLGTKKIITCDICHEVKEKLQGNWDKTFKKIIYKCKDCKIKV